MNLFKAVKFLTRLYLTALILATSGCVFEDSDESETDQISDVNILASITVSEGELSPGFTLEGTAYSVDVAGAVESIQITGVLENTSATFTINGEAAMSGAAVTATLSIGANSIPIVVTAESGDTRTITITVNRAELSSNANLSLIELSAGDLVPVFAVNTFSYNVSVNNATDNITITPTTEDATTSILVNGQAATSGTASDAIDLAIGNTTITVVTTSEDASSELTYSIIVTRDAPLSTDASLSGLSLSAASLSPVFDSAVLNYTASVPFTTETVTVTPVFSDANATARINGTSIASGATSSAIDLAEGDNNFSLIMLAEDGVSTTTYSIVVTRQAATTFAQLTYIKSSNSNELDFFGSSVAISGNTMVVGSHGESSNATGVNGDQTDNSSLRAGAAYVFVKNAAGEWSQQAYLKASNTADGAQFGTKVAIEGDTIMVGAASERGGSTGIDGDQVNNPISNSGAVYEFTRVNNVWTQTAYIKASNTGSNDRFGTSIALLGNTLAVGATGERSSATGVDGDQTINFEQGIGAVYIFKRDGAGSWSQQAYIKASNPDKNDNFGSSVELSGNTLAVAATGEGSSTTGINGDQSNNLFRLAGAVYIFTEDGGGTWSQQAYIKPSNSFDQDWFSDSISLSGDTLLVGATREDGGDLQINGDDTDNTLRESGAAYVFVRDGNGDWTQQAYLKPETLDLADLFGRTVKLQGDSAYVGLYYEDGGVGGIDGDETNNSVQNAGAVITFKRDVNGLWTQEHYIKAAIPGSSDNFSQSIATDGNTLVVSAYGEDSNATGINGNQGDDSLEYAGAVYVFRID